ncbi:Gfo/Idh/MocA family protein [Roseibacillus persicicus]|uniref:Oxidoreductase n=1 Tax=Roseibacillus persicicus TaxID=454148 RepID=A0A918WH25_9BACT|nr:Gfo/Idh/MocA family oxidoreductase [Roseibacillus persicicus]GHC50893.1 oxidoreductase [Roseibacillus persicicus]
MNNPIHTAIIGYGRSARFLHATGLLGNPQAFQVVAVTSRSEPSLAQARADFDCPTFTDYHRMLRECEIDLVVIVTRNDQHCEMACHVLAAGCHTLITKPLGITREEVARIYGTAEQAGKKVFPFLPARWGTDYRRIREIIESGEIGRVFAIHRSVYGFATRDDWQTESKFGGGIILNWGAHLIEPPMLLANSKPKHLFGSCAQVLNPGDAEDTFYSLITMENGVRVHSQWSFSPQALPHWFVQGTGGCIIGNDTKLEITTGIPTRPADPTKFKDMEGEGAETRSETVGDDLYGDPVEIYRDVAADLLDDHPYSVTRDEAIRLSSIFDGIKKSQQQETLIPLS